MSARLRTILIHTGGFALAALLLFLALRNVDLAEIGVALRQADYRWLGPVVVVLLGSHFLRAIRWCALMDVLGERTERRHGLAFSSLMIGYMVNYAAPRLGEVARTANFSRRTSTPFSGVLGTVVAERVLDVVSLAIGLAIVGIMLSDRLGALFRLLFEGQDLAGLGMLALAGVITLTLAVALLIFFIRMVRAARGPRYERLARRVRPIVYSFREGLMAAVSAPRRWTILLTTVAIWMCYMVAAYIPFAMLGMTSTYEIGLSAAWVMMILGSLGVVVPSPGGVGSYHYITIQGLAFLYGVTPAAAASYAFLTHGAQLVLYVIVGAVCLAVGGSLARASVSRESS